MKRVNKFWLLLARRRLKGGEFGPFSRLQTALAIRDVKLSVRQAITDVFLISLGILSAGFGLKGFLLPNRFVDGGATGIALITSIQTSFDLSTLLVLINIPFVIMGYKTIGKGFAIKTGVAIACLAIVVHSLPYPDITHEKILVAVFGGFFLGAGIGLSVRGGAVIDGTEVLAIFLSRRTGATIGDIILVFNIFIFSVAAWLLDVETALYSILTYLAASKTVDFIIEGIEEYTGVTIVSNRPEDIKRMIVDKMHKGVTIYQGKKGHGKRGETLQDAEIIYTVVTRLEVSRLNAEIERIDPRAFVVMQSVKDTRGGVVKARRLKDSH